MKKNGLFRFTGIIAAVFFLFTSVVFGQDRIVTGKITSKSDGTGVPGASIIVKGTTVGTTSDFNGDFSLSVPSAGEIIVISYIGYVTQEIIIGSQTTINVALVEDLQQLKEVIVIGYGSQERAKVTGAISSVSSAELVALPVPSVAAALQGRAAGVSVVNNGAPGEAPIVRIRGVGSISSNPNPLYVIDGFPTGDLNSFDTRDIESVEVLKDASAAAIYGSRAANGVVLITTKKGRAGERLSVNFDSYAGVQSAWKRLDLLNRDQYIQYGTALRTNAGELPPARFANLNTPIFAGASQTYAQTDTDWQDEMFRNASIQQHSVSITAGSEKSSFFASAGYFKQDGIMLGTGYERANFRLNSDHKISKRFTFGQTLGISYDDRLQEQQSGGRTQIQHMIRMTPYMPVRDPTRPGGFRGPDASDGTDPQNPVRVALQDQQNQQRMKVLGNAYVEAKIFDGLTYRFTGGLDYSSTRTFTFLPVYNESFNARFPAVITDNRGLFFSTIFTNLLTYDKTFGKHSFNAIGVAERQDFRFIGLQGSGNLPNNDIRELAGLTNQTASGGRFESTLFSYLGRLNYEFDGKYLVSASVRYDGSSRLAPGRKWSTFPAASLGWRISEENFMKGFGGISELKLRASYGSMGYAGLGEYDWQATILQNTAAVFGGGTAVGAFFNNLPNTDLGWEVTTMTNAGFDLGLLNNKFTFSFEVFNRGTDGLILQRPIPPSLGFRVNPTVNVGGMRNWGYEFEMGYNQQWGDFRLNAAGNLSIIRNRVTNLATETATIFAGQNADFGGFDITRTIAGEPIQSFFGWRVGGIIQSQAELEQLNSRDGNPNNPYQAGAAPGDIWFVDTDGDGVITPNDRVNLGSFLPDFTYGLNISAAWKNFDLTMFIQGVHGGKIYNGTSVLTQGMLRLFNSGVEVLDAWTPTNTNTNIPRAVDGDPNRNTRTSDRFLEDASFLRIKNLSLGYSLPSNTLSSVTKNTVQRARIYVSTLNLLTFTKYTGYDPEVGSRNNNNLTNGIDFGQFPQARTIMMGVQLGF